MPVWLEDNTCIRADDALALLVRVEAPPNGVGAGRLLVMLWLADLPNAIPIATCASPTAAIQKVEEIRTALEDGKKLATIAPGVAVLGEKVKGFGIKLETNHALPWGVQVEVEGAGIFLVVRCNSQAVAEAEIVRMVEQINSEDKIIYTLGNNCYIRRDTLEYISVRAAAGGKKMLQAKIESRDALLPIMEFEGETELAAHMEQLSKTLNEGKEGDDLFGLLPCGWGFLPSHVRLINVRSIESREHGQLWHIILMHEKIDQPAVLFTHADENVARATLADYAKRIKKLSEEPEEDSDKKDEDEDSEEE